MYNIIVKFTNVCFCDAWDKGERDKREGSGVDTNFEKLETVGLPTHNFQEPQVKFRSPNLFLTIRPAPPGKSSLRAIGVSGHNIANVEVDFYMLHSVISTINLAACVCVCARRKINCN